MTRKLCRAIFSKVLRSWKINIGVESVKATARIEPNGYKKKLLASQTHLDLQTVPALALYFFPPFSSLISILVSVLRDILSPFLWTHFYSGGLSSTTPFFSQGCSGYFLIPLLHTRSLNYRCLSQSAATHSSASISDPKSIAREIICIYINAKGNIIRN